MSNYEKISTINMTHEDWLKERRHSIGGSDVGALLGLNRYRSPYTVWAEKTGRLPEQPDNEAMRQGRDLEDYVAKRFAERSGKQVARYNFLLRSPDCPHLHANIDRRVLGERSGLECKTASALNMKVYARGQFPESYYAQCVSYLAVTGWERWYLAALVLNKAFFVYQLTTIEDDPVPDWCDGSVYVSKSEIELFGKESSLAAYTQLMDTKKDVERQIEEIKQLLMQDMGSAAKARCGPFKLSWAGQERKTLDGAKLKKLYPEIELDKCYKTTYVRPFKITEEK